MLPGTIRWLDGKHKCTVIRAHTKDSSTYKVKTDTKYVSKVRAHRLLSYRSCDSDTEDEAVLTNTVRAVCSDTKYAKMKIMWRVTDGGSLAKVAATYVPSRRRGGGFYHVGENVLSPSLMVHRPHPIGGKFFIRKRGERTGYVRCTVLQFSDTTGFYTVAEDVTGLAIERVQHHTLHVDKPKLAYGKSLHNGLPLGARRSRGQGQRRRKREPTLGNCSKRNRIEQRYTSGESVQAEFGGNWVDAKYVGNHNGSFTIGLQGGQRRSVSNIRPHPPPPSLSAAQKYWCHPTKTIPLFKQLAYGNVKITSSTQRPAKRTKSWSQRCTRARMTW